MEEGENSLGLLISLMIGVAVMAACGIVAFSLFLVAYFAF